MVKTIIKAILDSTKDDKIIKRVKEIEFRSSFRAPENQDQTYLDLAMEVRKMIGIEIAEVLVRLAVNKNPKEEPQ